MTPSSFHLLSLSRSPAFAAVRAGTRVELLKKATCGTVSIQSNRQYLVMGASGTEVIINRSFRSVSVLLRLLLNLLQLPAVSCFYLPRCSAPAGIASLWTQTRWWSCGPQSAAHGNVTVIWPTWTSTPRTCCCWAARVPRRATAGLRVRTEALSRSS